MHIIGGSHKGGAYKGASILHHSLLKFGIESKIINDKNFYNNSENEINIFNENSLKKILNIFYIYFEKFIKFIFLKVLDQYLQLEFLVLILQKLKSIKRLILFIFIG